MKTNISPRPDDNYRTQEKWIRYFNKENKAMISMPDVFQIVKENNTEAIEALRKDFKEHWLVTSTRIIYDEDNISAKIIHDADSTVRKPTEIKLKQIPVCRPTYIKDILNNAAGLEYLRALVNQKKATKEQLTTFFEKISGKKEKNIRFWTPTQSSREDKEIRAVILCFCSFGRFFVDGGWFDDDSGLSHGVTINPAKQGKSKIKKICPLIKKECIKQKCEFWVYNENSQEEGCSLK